MGASVAYASPAFETSIEHSVNKPSQLLNAGAILRLESKSALRQPAGVKA